MTTSTTHTVTTFFAYARHNVLCACDALSDLARLDRDTDDDEDCIARAEECLRYALRALQKIQTTDAEAATAHDALFESAQKTGINFKTPALPRINHRGIAALECVFDPFRKRLAREERFVRETGEWHFGPALCVAGLETFNPLDSISHHPQKISP